MAINTARVTGRRQLRFESLDAVLADAEYLASVPTRQLGNWSLGSNSSLDIRLLPRRGAAVLKFPLTTNMLF